MTTSAAASLTKLRENVGLAYRGDVRAVDLLLTALLSRGHVLIEDVPGVGKTTLARALGRSLALDFRRIQFTSDTLPADVIGISVFDSQQTKFVFHRGPIFANIVLADEINRAPPRTQSALLEAMSEGKAVSSQCRSCRCRFWSWPRRTRSNTRAPIRCPRATLIASCCGSRWAIRAETEEKMLLRRGGTERVLAAIPSVLGPHEVLALQDQTERVTVSDRLLDYLHSLVRATRQTPELRLPVSTRGAQALFRATQARALLDGREYATPDDVQAVAEAVLAHRILSVSSDGFGAGGRERELVKKIVAQVAVPV